MCLSRQQYDRQHCLPNAWAKAMKLQCLRASIALASMHQKQVCGCGGSAAKVGLMKHVFPCVNCTWSHDTHCRPSSFRWADWALRTARPWTQEKQMVVRGTTWGCIITPYQNPCPWMLLSFYFLLIVYHEKCVVVLLFVMVLISSYRFSMENHQNRTRTCQD